MWPCVRLIADVRFQPRNRAISIASSFWRGRTPKGGCRFPGFEHHQEVGVVVLKVFAAHKFEHFLVIEIVADDDRNISVIA